jgi:hypothetical protein
VGGDHCDSRALGDADRRGTLFYNARAVQLVADQQAADRFSRAVEQLSKVDGNSLSVRLGGVYALKALMIDSPAYRETAVEVLSAFVRARSPRPVEPSKLPADGDKTPQSSTDVIAAVVVLAQRPNPGETAPDLSEALLGLAGVNAPHANLSRARLELVRLRSASLNDAHLEGAQLDDASLAEANLNKAQLQNADLGGAYLGGADLRGANLTGTTLSKDWRAQIGLACIDGTTVLPGNPPTPSPGASATAETAPCGRWH